MPKNPVRDFHPILQLFGVFLHNIQHVGTAENVEKIPTF